MVHLHGLELWFMEKRHLWDHVDPFYGWQGERGVQRAGPAINTMDFYPGLGR